jgi:predicted ester cyclase
VLVIANCVALGNDIFLEHVLYNTSSMLEQLGFDVGGHAAKLAANPLPGWPRDGDAWNSLREATSTAQPISISDPIPGFDPDRFVRAAFDRIWNQRDFAALPEIYQAGFRFDGPTNRTFTGTAAYSAFLSTLLTAFPDLALRVDEVYWMGNEAEGYLVATRWSAEAAHGGAGLYGEPTGRRIQMWGISQQEIKNGSVRREWMLFNEFDLMIQIAQNN